MGLKEVLSKMKLVELEETRVVGDLEPAPSIGSSIPPFPKPPADIGELLGTLPEPKIDEAKLPDPEPGEPAEIPDFPDIYKAAGITDPPHGYTAYKILEIFSSPGFSALDTRAKAAALTGFLNMNPTGPVPITDVVQDAVRRDQAIDKFEEFLRAKMAARAEQIDKENAALQAEIDELTRRNRDRMETNRIALETEQARLTRWQIVKRAEERKLFDAVNPFVEANPISTADHAPRPSVPPAAPESDQT